jgi:hypothetical protein
MTGNITQRIKVDGLAMNADNTAIVYTSGNAEVECATVTEGRTRILNRVKYTIVPTGACTFENVETVKNVDDGF